MANRPSYHFLLEPTVFPLACHSCKWYVPFPTGTYRLSTGMPLMSYGICQFILAPTVFPLACRSCKTVSTRDVHFWQKYYSIFAQKYSNNIRKSVNQEPPTQARTQAPRIHAHTMTQGEAIMICMKSICSFQQLHHQHLKVPWHENLTL